RRPGGTTPARRREAAARGPPEDGDGPTDESWASAAEAGPRKRADEAVGAARGPPEDGDGPADESWASAAEAGQRKRADEKPSARRAVRLRKGRDLRTSRRRA